MACKRLTATAKTGRLPVFRLIVNMITQMLITKNCQIIKSNDSNTLLFTISGFIVIHVLYLTVRMTEMHYHYDICICI